MNATCGHLAFAVRHAQDLRGPDGRTRRGRPIRVGGHLVDRDTLADPAAAH